VRDVAVKIAQIAPLFESVPPRLYGGTERVVCYLTEELVQQGHDVTLFASADSVTSADLVSCAARSLRLDTAVRDPYPHYMLMLEKVRERADDFDILHFHIDYWHFPLFRPIAGRTLTTVHGRLDIPDLLPLYHYFQDIPLVSISDAQRKPIAAANFVATVHHGIPLHLHTPTLQSHGEYVAFLGRISPEKGVDRAIAIARACGVPLKIAAKVDKTDEEYFRHIVRPLLDQPGVEFIGEINEQAKTAFLGGARALLFPVDWPEPFGLVMIEAMSCATPVLAFTRGSVPEIIDEGLTGCMVNSVEEAIAKLDRVMSLPRGPIRRQFEARFSAARMAHDYANLYQRAQYRQVRSVLAGGRPRPHLNAGPGRKLEGPAVAPPIAPREIHSLPPWNIDDRA
jgi:glycosyltransferase involved in cell wall biosynthesis